MADPTTIAAGTRVNGRVEGSQDVAVEGVVDGEISLSETLTVSEPGLVRADVEVREALIAGALEGEIRATERIVLTSTARVTGTLDAPAIRIEDGASFSGDVIMDLEGAAASTSRRTSPTERTTASSTSSSTTTTRTSSSSTGSSTSSSSGAATKPYASQTTTVVETEEEEEEPEEAASDTEESVAEPDFGDMPEDEVYEFTVKELREELRERDLPVSGTKDELIERLREDDEG